MMESPNEEERRSLVDNNSLLQYTHPLSLVHYNHEYEGATGNFELSRAATPLGNGNVINMHDKKGGSLMGMAACGSDIFYGDEPIVSAVSEETVSQNNETLQCLEDFKCPICLDTFINTVKVDCSYGHKFCNYCIQSWISFERHLVTECPVCRGPIFGKSLDLKTDAEIRVIYESLPEDERNNRLLSIKERLQMECPNSLIANMPQFSPEHQYPMRFSDAQHHHFNHDLHMPIPLMSVLEGAMQLSTNSQENDYFQNFENDSAQVWQQGIFYPSEWNESVYSQNFQSTHIQNVGSMSQPNQIEPVDPVDVHHQHYRHQIHESSRWNNNLYLTTEDTITSSPQPQLMGESDVSRHDVSSTNYPLQTVGVMPYQSNSHDMPREQNVRLHPPILNYSAVPVTPRNLYQVEHYSPPFSSHSPVPIPVAHASAQPRITTASHLNGFYGSYLSTCPGHRHHCSPSAQYAQSTLHSANSHRPVFDGCSEHSHHQMSCPNSGSSIGHTPIETNSFDTASRNIPVISYSRNNRSNVAGVAQLATPLNPCCSSGYRSSNYHRSSARNSLQSGIRQPVSRCPASNNGAHFSGGFSLFSSGYMGFQISHTPTTMMIGNRCLSTPPARLTHPLVSLFPLNQDGSSTRVCLTFEVHRV